MQLDQSRIHPTLAIISNNLDIMITCKATSVSWRFNDDPNLLPNVRVVNATTLMIKRVMDYNEGKYECSGLTERSQPFSAISTIEVKSEPNWVPTIIYINFLT